MLMSIRYRVLSQPGVSAWLTNQSRTERYGPLVLRLQTIIGTVDLGPHDTIEPYAAEISITAGELVLAWRKDPRRTQIERDAAALFLRTTPDRENYPMKLTAS